ncbi:hypothetical protein HG536_0F04690 [Torulaspora globosa]|uniref:Uncharacterized protein n=1 Tax=Torulaspora globosa TaxID=48254 RepID=A0A7G3ZKV6_9SACH|nr:uncharacterized protein HG536_0F04690 [Torulaspora globosa]QLL34142.1 hypothetical protein HG536_0F04690 [Torulaspora globosa]
MAKKVSRHSRAARRAVDEEPEPKALSQLPRAEKTDLTNILTRTAAKNEALLEAKLRNKNKNKVSKKHIKEKLSASVVGADKERFERALNVANRLDGKIARSVSRAKYVQNARKAGWDSTNEQIRRERTTTTNQAGIADKEHEAASEDATENDDPNEVTEGDSDKISDTNSSPKNLFSVLTDDVEV